jgi:hypothetical protein
MEKGQKNVEFTSDENASIRMESIVNKGDKPPFAYYAPQSNGKVTWHCGYDTKDQLISVFCFKEAGNEDRRPSVLKGISQALEARKVLIEEGWLPLDAPQITTKTDGVDKPLNRKQKRNVAKKLKKEMKNNPLEEEENPQQ